MCLDSIAPPDFSDIKLTDRLFRFQILERRTEVEKEGRWITGGISQGKGGSYEGFQRFCGQVMVDVLGVDSI